MGTPSQKSGNEFPNGAVPGRVGRVQRQVFRAFIVSNGRPRTTGQLIRYCYPRLTRFEHWHYNGVKRAAQRFAMQIATSAGGRGKGALWGLRSGQMLPDCFPKA